MHKTTIFIILLVFTSCSTLRFIDNNNVMVSNNGNNVNCKFNHKTISFSITPKNSLVTADFAIIKEWMNLTNKYKKKYIGNGAEILFTAL